MPYPKGQARDQAWNDASRDKQKGKKRGPMSQDHKDKIGEGVAKRAAERKKARSRSEN